MGRNVRGRNVMGRNQCPPTTQQGALRRKYRVGIRIVHRAPFVRSADLSTFTGEAPLDNYVRKYIRNRLKKIYSSDLGSSLFLEDIFFWDKFQKIKNDGVGHLFNLKRVKRLKLKHRSLLLDWLLFLEQGDSNLSG